MLSSAAGDLVLCFNIDCDAGLKVHGEVIFEYGDFRDLVADHE